ncbi:MAG: putative serine/threonine-protein kinase Nek11 [Streblomastix strix]|uniref:non-specific serine/threonine protein kinase n=1 Tax=Streblomastix strix TaxID=222440 RepID=A0A5J4VNY9_9EUKA|nr:MAG: putative serine/threonine-protein kinase Nek11 [Streblomastix strix]
MNKPQDQPIEPDRPPNNSDIVVQPRVQIEKHQKNLTDYVIVQQTGKGAFANVYSAVNSISKELVCLKVLTKEIKKDIPKELQVEKNHERKYFMKFDSAFIVKYKDCFISHERLILELELCQLGSLGNLIDQMQCQKKKIPEFLIVDWMIQILLALQLLKLKKIIHRDVKPSNIFLTKDLSVKLGDFDDTITMSKGKCKTEHSSGTRAYRSPEANQVIEKGKKIEYNSKTDIWSLGITLYELCCLKRPFNGKTNEKMLEQINEKELDRIPEIYSEGLWNLIQWMLMKDYKFRPSAKDILKKTSEQEIRKNEKEKNEKIVKANKQDGDDDDEEEEEEEQQQQQQEQKDKKKKKPDKIKKESKKDEENQDQDDEQGSNSDDSKKDNENKRSRQLRSSKQKKNEKKMKKSKKGNKTKKADKEDDGAGIGLDEQLSNEEELYEEVNVEDDGININDKELTSKTQKNDNSDENSELEDGEKENEINQKKKNNQQRQEKKQEQEQEKEQKQEIEQEKEQVKEQQQEQKKEYKKNQENEQKKEYEKELEFEQQQEQKQQVGNDYKKNKHKNNEKKTLKRNEKKNKEEHSKLNKMKKQPNKEKEQSNSFDEYEDKENEYE